MFPRHRSYLAVALLTCLVLAGFSVSPVPQPQRVETLVERVEKLEAEVARQGELIETLLERVQVLEGSAAGSVDTSQWIQATSSDGQVTYLYSPDWTVVPDVPNGVGFMLEDSGTLLYFGWHPGWHEVELLLQDWDLLEEYIQEGAREELGAEIELMEHGERLFAGHTAFYWDAAVTVPEILISVRGQFLLYYCGNNITCVAIVGKFGRTNVVAPQDWAMFEAFAKSVVFTNVPTVQASANLRGCPSLTCDIVGRAEQGQVLDLVGQNEDGTWFKLRSGEWISASLVDNAPENLPIVETEAGVQTWSYSPNQAGM
ncbi:MAG TPA: SH3 domain-containing protein [Caldilineaceae bacterium]|nr:SH3 domain-containing protein [Caldilineaceae bacterium]